MRRITIFLLQFIIIAAVALSALAFTAPAADGLPPRPSTPTPVPPSATEQPVRGALIILQQSDTEPFPAQAWTVVQWQNEAGRWYDVEGWQGTFDSNDRVVWWVSPDSLGDGPFRWQVYDSAARDELLATSEAFDLPAHNGQRLVIDLQLP